MRLKRKTLLQTTAAEVDKGGLYMRLKRKITAGACDGARQGEQT